MLTDKGAQSLSNLVHLESLDLSGCTSLTDQSMHIIASLPHLTDLKLARCFSLTDAAVNIILDQTSERHGRLCVDMRHCHTISAEALDQLQSACSQLLRSRY